jgi:hypothetical protein
MSDNHLSSLIAIFWDIPSNNVKSWVLSQLQIEVQWTNGRLLSQRTQLLKPLRVLPLRSNPFSLLKLYTLLGPLCIMLMIKNLTTFSNNGTLIPLLTIQISLLMMMSICPVSVPISL